MKARFLSRRAARRVVEALVAVGICLVGLVAALAAGVQITHPVAVGACLVGLVVVLAAGVHITHHWHYSWRSTQVLCGLNERTQTLDEQLQITEKALSLNPRNWDAWLLRAHKLTEQKRYREAAGHWAQVRNRGPGGITDTSFADQGMCLLFAHQQAEAIVYLEETIRRLPGHVTARGFLAATYADLGLHDRVREELVKLANLKPSWQQQFEACSEYPEEHKAALMRLEPYLKNPENEDSSRR